jgi:DHA1 family bicyclomycin/chloramphenicol resistance-like MFS transporter
VQATLTATAVGMGAGQLVVGPLSDALGRRWPLVIATTMHIGASALIALSPSIELVALARFAQGFGAAGGAIVASAMVRDLFGGQRLVKMAAQVALVSGFAPIIAPVIGSQLLLVVSWRGVFWILACYGLAVVFTAVLLIPETRTRRGRGLSPRDMIRNVQILVGDRIYVSTVAVSAMVFAVIITYLSSAPFIYQDGYGVSAQAFGMIFAATSVGVLVATQIAARLMRRVRPSMLLAFALPAAVAVGAFFCLIDAAELGVVAFAISSFAVVAFQGFCNPCLQVLTLADHENESGTAVAMSGFVNSVLGGLLSLLPGLIGGVEPMSLGIVVMLAAGVGYAAVFAGLRPRSSAAIAAE